MSASRPETFTDKPEIFPLPIIGPYNVQRFRQFSPEDAANWYVVKGENTKRPYSMYPTMGRAHINYLGYNVLVFPAEPRGHFHSISYWYSVVGNTVYRVDSTYTKIPIGNLRSTAGNVFFDYLVVNTIVFACFVDTEKIYVYQEDTGVFSEVTDPNAPGNVTTTNSAGVVSVTKPGYIVAFGNRIAVSVANSSQFYLSEINLLTPSSTAGVGATFNPALCFTVGSVTGTNPVAGAAVFAQEDGIIGQMGTLNNKLYIFCDYTTGVWSNIVATLSNGVTFPWKKSASYNWNFGIADALSLSVGFGFLIFLAQNSEGLVQVMLSSGDEPRPVSTKAIDVLFQRYSDIFGGSSPFLSGNAVGFLYQYENTIFYRLSGGTYTNEGLLDQEQNENSIEYNFDTNTWERCIEMNGERCRIQRHIFFNNQHLVTLIGDSTVYRMSGQFYYNETRNALQPNDQATDAYIKYPFRYERVTPIVCQPDYSEFQTDYVEIDFVFGDSDINFFPGPFPNTTFIIDEEVGSDGGPQYLITEYSSTVDPTFIIEEGTNTPEIEDNIYNISYKPSIELFFSNDGGISFQSADVREFSRMGVYQWRMRWYQLGASRNRVYKLIAVSPVPIVILGGVMMVRRSSGGAN